MNTICCVEEIEKESSYNSDFSSHVESCHEDKVGSEFKVYNNALYDDACEDEQSMFYPNVQRGSLHGVINPLFEEDVEFSDLAGLDANCDTLSYCCNKLEYCSSIPDVEISNDAIFGECEDEVFDGVSFEEKLTLHGNFCDDSNEVNTNQHFNYEDTSEGYEMFSDYDEDVICDYKSDCSFDIQLETLEEMQSQGELKMHDIYNFFYENESEHFVFLVDSMHESVNKDEFQFYVDIHENVDVIFHSEQEVSIMPSFNMCYESQGVDSVLLSDEIRDVYIIGETDMRSNFSLPHVSSDENRVYDRGKQFC